MHAKQLAWIWNGSKTRLSFELRNEELDDDDDDDVISMEVRRLAKKTSNRLPAVLSSTLIERASTMKQPANGTHKVVKQRGTPCSWNRLLSTISDNCCTALARVRDDAGVWYFNPLVLWSFQRSRAFEVAGCCLNRSVREEEGLLNRGGRASAWNSSSSLKLIEREEYVISWHWSYCFEQPCHLI